MSRKRLAILLAIPTLIIVLLVGLTRGNETNEGTDEQTSTTLPARTGEEAASAAVLRPADEVIEVAADTGCEALTDDAEPVCQGFQVLDTEVAWLVEQDAQGPPVVSFLRRESPTSWRRVLTADGGAAAFEAVNVRVDDLSGDGRVEAVFGFHQGNRLQIDIVDADGTVALHFDAATGQARVEDGLLTVWQPEAAEWRRQSLRLTPEGLEVVDNDLVDGPAEGNI